MNSIHPNKILRLQKPPKWEISIIPIAPAIHGSHTKEFKLPVANDTCKSQIWNHCSSVLESNWIWKYTRCTIFEALLLIASVYLWQLNVLWSSTYASRWLPFSLTKVMEIHGKPYECKFPINCSQYMHRISTTHESISCLPDQVSPLARGHWFAASDLNSARHGDLNQMNHSSTFKRNWLRQQNCPKLTRFSHWPKLKIPMGFLGQNRWGSLADL